MLAALMCALVYLALCSRVLVDITAQAHGKKHTAHVVVHVWGVSVSVSEAGGKMPGKRQFALLRRLAPLIRAALGTLRLGQFDLRVRLGIDDAAATAVVSGAIRVAVSAVLAAVGQVSRSDVRIDADYRAPCFVLYGRCIFSLIPGDIMFAVVKAAVKKTQREGFKWLSIPSRA